MNDSVAEDPDSLHASVAHAWVSYHAGNWLESSARWDRVRELFPDYAPPYIHGGNSLRKNGQLHEALEKLTLGANLFPDHPQLVTSVAACLEQMGRFQEMDEWLERAMPRFPDNPEIGVEYIRLLHSRKDYPSLLRGSEAVGIQYPEVLRLEQGVRHMISDARLQFEMDKMDAGLLGEADLDSVEFSSPDAELTETELVVAFQSLGENCEFGLTQRHFQAEPLGLLRWAAISVECLTQALNEKFDGVGLREHTKFIVGNNEYATAHATYGMGSHTFVKVDKDNQEAIFDKLLARLTYLRRKLIEDLEEGAQTFVYTCEKGTTEQKRAKLHEAIQSYGSRYLLFVCKTDEDNPPGTLKYVGNGLMMGYIERLGPDRLPEGDLWKICYHQWMPLLRAAHEMRRRDEAAMNSRRLKIEAEIADVSQGFVINPVSEPAADQPHDFAVVDKDIVVVHDPLMEAAKQPPDIQTPLSVGLPTSSGVDLVTALSQLPLKHS